MLKKWIGQPLKDLKLLSIRQSTVEWFYERTMLRDSTRKQLKNISDIIVISSDNNPVAVPITTGELGLECNSSGEAYEGMFVEYTNVTVESVDNYGNYYINVSKYTSLYHARENFLLSFDVSL